MPVAGALAVTVWAQHNITINSACQLVVSMARLDLDRRRGMTVPRSRRHNAEERRCPDNADSTQIRRRGMTVPRSRRHNAEE